MASLNRTAPPANLTLAIFPLRSSAEKHPDMAFAFPVSHDPHTMETLSTLDGVTIALAMDIHWGNAAYWVHKGNLHTMSTADIDAYNPFLFRAEPQARAAYQMAMWSEHYAVLYRLGMAPWGLDAVELRFRRLPVAGQMTDQVKRALLERERAMNLAEEALTGEGRRERRVWEDVVPWEFVEEGHEEVAGEGEDGVPADRPAPNQYYVGVGGANGEVLEENRWPGHHEGPRSTIPSSHTTTTMPQPALPTAVEDIIGRHPITAATVTIEDVPDVESTEVTAAPPLIAEVGERVMLLTREEAYAAEQAWAECGADDWYERYSVLARGCASTVEGRRA